MASSPGPACHASHSPAGTTGSSRPQPRRAVSASLSTPFWMKRLPPVKGKTRSTLAASAPLRASK